MAMTLSSEASPITVYLVSGENVRPRLAKLVGHRSPRRAKEEDPQSIRALYGIDDHRNCVWWTRGDESFRKLHGKLFGGHHSDYDSDADLDHGAHGGSDAKSRAFELEPVRETLLVIKPDTVCFADAIEDALADHGFFAAKAETLRLDKAEWAQFYHFLADNEWFEELCEWMASGPVRAYSLFRVRAIEYLWELVGPTDPEEAKAAAPQSLRAYYGVDRMRNAFHCCWDEESVARDRVHLFPAPESWPKTVPRDHLLAIIKPNAAKVAGDRIRAHLVGSGFDIVSEREAYFQEQIYKELQLDVAPPQYAESVLYIASGPVVVMVLEKVNGFGDIVDVVGHRDPAMARPQTIRAIYGRTAVENAIEVSLNDKEYRHNLEVFYADDKLAGGPHSDAANAIDGRRPRHEQQHSESMANVRGGQRQHALLIVKPHIKSSNALNRVFQMLREGGFKTVTRSEHSIGSDSVYHFVTAFEGEDPSLLDALCDEWSSGKVTVLELRRSDAADPFECLRSIVGPADPEIARSEMPSSIRAKLGQDRIRNCCWYSVDAQQYRQKRHLF